MQPIERVGVFALLFLVVMVVAVWLFDRQPEDLSTEVAASERASSAESVRDRTSGSVPQLGQTTKSTRSKPATSGSSAASDWKQRKADREALQAEERAALSKSKALPVSAPKPQLTPAPKRDLEVVKSTGRHKPANKPSGILTPKKKAEVLQPKTPVIGSQVGHKGQSKPVASPSGRSSNPLGEYVVKSGDTLSEISQRQLGTATRWKEIEALNGVNANQLKVGMKLRLPLGRTTTTAGTPKPTDVASRSASKATSKGSSYRVSEGDSLWVIAQRQLGDGSRWAEIAALNSSIDPDKLVVGTTLALPTGAAKQKTTVIAKNSTPARSTSTKPRVR